MGQRRKQVELPVYNLIGTPPLTHQGGSARVQRPFCAGDPEVLGALKALHSRWRCGACEAEKGAEVQDGTLHGNCWCQQDVAGRLRACFSSHSDALGK